MYRWCLLFLTIPLLAQQQIVPEELSPEQGKLFSELTQAVSAPCCNNGIPVAFHMSGMANQIRDEIKNAILAGKTKSEIFDQLAETKYGQDGRSIIFTIPERTPIGYLAYILPAGFCLAGIIFVVMYSKRRRNRDSIPDEELLTAYRDAILNKMGQGS